MLARSGTPSNPLAPLQLILRKAQPKRLGPVTVTGPALAGLAEAYVAAINRAQIVITDFQGVPASEPALYIMMMSYEKLGMKDMRDDVERVLVKNYPDSKLLAEGFPNKYAAWNILKLF